MPVTLNPGDITAIAARINAGSDADPAARVQSLRAEVKALCEGGPVPSLSREEYANALVKLAGGTVDGASAVSVRSAIDGADRAVNELNGGVRTERKTVASLDGQLAQLETDNQRRFDASVAAFGAMQNQLAGVLTNGRVANDNRVDAFFRIAQINQRLAPLRANWAAYQAKQAQFRATLDGMRAREATINTGDDGSGDVMLALVQRQVGLQLLIANLREQTAILRQMVASASGANNALQGIEGALAQETAKCAAFVDAVTSDGVSDLLGRVLGLAAFGASLVADGPFAVAASVAGLLKEILLGDVAGVRDDVETLVWSAVGRFVTGGLVDAGVAEPWARMLVAGVRASAHAVADERANAASLVTDAVRAGLNEAQRGIVDFLVRDADPALPLASLVRQAIAMTSMTADDAAHIRDGVARPLVGIDAAIALLGRV